MSSFTLNNTASDIDSAISRVVSADDTPTANSDNMVTSTGVKTALNELGAASVTTTLYNSNLSTLVDYINTLSVPPQMSTKEFRYFPFAHTQGTITFAWSGPGSGGKYSTTYNVVVHAYDQSGNQISSTPVATSSVSMPTSGGSGTFTGSFATTTVGTMKFTDNYASDSGINITVQSSNPSLTSLLSI